MRLFLCNQLTGQGQRCLECSTIASSAAHCTYRASLARGNGASPADRGRGAPPSAVKRGKVAPPQPSPLRHGRRGKRLFLCVIPSRSLLKDCCRAPLVPLTRVCHLALANLTFS